MKIKKANWYVALILSITVILGMIPMALASTPDTADVIALNAELKMSGDTHSVAFDGSGDSSSPYLISTPSELSEMAELVNSGDANYRDAHYKLTNDIDFADYDYNGDSLGWEAIGKNYSYSFRGVFDGNGKVISNLNMVRTGNMYQGLFAYISGGTVKDLGIVNCNYNVYSYGGAIAGHVSSGTVLNCYATGVINGRNSVGGVVGQIQNSSLVENCYSYCEVTGTGSTGGIVGGVYGNSKVLNCYNAGKVKSSGNDVGGIVGYVSGGTIENCYNTGGVNGTAYVGGLVGYALNNVNTINNCYNTGNIKGDGNTVATVFCAYTGGIIGFAGRGTALENCYSTGSVEGTGKYTGGMAGYINYNNISVVNCASLAQSVLGDNDSVGRFMGGLGPDFSGTISENFVWNGMTVNGSSVSNSDINGTGKTAAELETAAVWSGYAAPVWQYAESKLPVLNSVGGSQDANMPQYLAERVVVTSFAIKPDQIVASLGANILINYSAQNLDGKILTVEMLDHDGGVIGSAEGTGGKALIKLNAAPAVNEEEVFTIVAKVNETELAQDTIKVVPYNTNIWEVNTYSENDFVAISFNAEITARDGKFDNEMTLNGERVGFVQVGNNLVTDVKYESLASGENIFIVNGVKYPRLFPSYSFTFTAPVFID